MTMTGTREFPPAAGVAPAPMSKSQKKRMKQKAAAAKKKAAEARAAQDAPVSASALNPIERLKSDMMARGFEAPEIDRAMDEMWERSMQYDDAGEVEDYLRRSRGEFHRLDAFGGSGSGSGSASPADADEEESWVRVPAAKDAASAAETGGTGGGNDGSASATEQAEGEPADESSGPAVSMTAVVENDKDDEEEAAEEETARVPAPATPNPAPAASPPSPASESRRLKKKPANDICDKLLVVANSEQLGDAVYALNEWVEKVAKPSEVSSSSPFPSSRAGNRILIPSMSISLGCLFVMFLSIAPSLILCTFANPSCSLPSTPNTLPQIAALCNPERCAALPTILRRAVEASGKPEDGPVARLLSSVLLGAGADPALVPAAAEAAGSALALSRSVVQAASEGGDSGMAVRDGCPSLAAGWIASDLSRAAGRLAANGGTGGRSFGAAGPGPAEAIRSLEAEVDALALALPTGGATDGGLLGKLARRDCHRAAAEKSAAVVGIALASSRTKQAGSDEGGGGDAGDDGAARDEETARTEMEASILGEERVPCLTAREEFDSLRSDLEAARSAAAEGRAALQAEADGLRAKREAAELRMSELRREMERLERESDVLVVRVAELDAKITEADSALNGRTREIKAALSARSGKLRLEEAARGAAGALVALGAALEGAASPPPAAVIASPSLPEDAMCPSQISKKMGMYFVRVRNYFKAEADCVEFIAGRAATLEAGLPDLRREIEECRALGMTTNVSQMARSMEDMADNIAEDRGVLEMMRAEAGGTQEAFLGVLEEYLSGTAPDGETGQQGGMGGARLLTPLQASVLGGIRDAMERIGLPDLGLAERIGSASSSSSAPPANGSGDAGEDAGADSDEAGGPAPPAREAPPPPAPQTQTQTQTQTQMPKLSWAAGSGSRASASASESGPGGAAGGRKSLLEIQQEELSGRT